MAAPTSVPSEDMDIDLSSVSFEIEKLIVDEIHSDLTQDMQPEEVSFVMMSEKLLLLEEYKEFVKMMDSGTPRQKLNEFLLECLERVERAVRGRDGLLNRLHQILSSTDRKQLANTVKTKMADYSKRSELKSKWKIEWKNMARKIKEMEQEIAQLRSLNQRMIEAIRRFRADCDICVYHPRKSTHWVHPESEQSRSEISDSSSNTSEVESNASDMTITSFGDHFGNSVATMIPNFDNLSVLANPNVVNRMAELWPLHIPISKYSSTMSLVSSASEKSATEAENSKCESEKSNSGSTGSLSSGTNKTKVNAGVKKLPDHPNDSTTSARTDLLEYKEPEIKDSTATQIDIATLCVEPMKSLVDSSIGTDIGNAKDTDNAAADRKQEQTQPQAILELTISKETNRQKKSSNEFHEIMKNRRALTDSGLVCPDLQSRLELPNGP